MMPTMNDDELQITPATLADLADIRALLVGASLPLDGLAEHWRMFLVARTGGKAIGCAGAEAYPFAALIRSIAVDPGYRSRGVGRKLVRHILDRLSARGLREFYLLTTNAEPYFQRRGFKRIEWDEVNPQILGSTQFQGACPRTATCMRLVMH
jgi:amino-acid N-acetyltransferase